MSLKLKIRLAAVARMPSARPTMPQIIPAFAWPPLVASPSSAFFFPKKPITAAAMPKGIPKTPQQGPSGIDRMPKINASRPSVLLGAPEPEPGAGGKGDAGGGGGGGAGGYW